MNRPPLPSFTLETASQKVRMAEGASNTRDPARQRQSCLSRRVSSAEMLM